MQKKRISNLSLIKVLTIVNWKYRVIYDLRPLAFISEKKHGSPISHYKNNVISLPLSIPRNVPYSPFGTVSMSSLPLAFGGGEGFRMLAFIST